MLYNISFNKKTMFEYLVIIITIFFFVISSYLVLGSKFKDSIVKSSCELTDGIYVIGEKVGEGYCSKK